MSVVYVYENIVFEPVRCNLEPYFYYAGWQLGIFPTGLLNVVRLEREKGSVT